MLAALSAAARPPLRKLQTRDDDDFTIALLDATAMMAVVLTFYQERIANECYMRTATERRSLLELARLIGYELRPGVAASTYLAFTLEDSPGAPRQTIIDIGTKVQSVPGPGEQAQTFETVEKIEARPEWNALKPRLTKRQQLSVDMTNVFLQGTSTNLKLGDALLIIVDAGNRVAKRVSSVTPDEKAMTTKVDFTSQPSSAAAYGRPSLQKGYVNDVREKELAENTVHKILTRSWSEAALSDLARMKQWGIEELAKNIRAQTQRRAPEPDKGVFALRQRAAIFGYNAPKWDSLPATLRVDQQIKKYKLENGNSKFDKYEFVPAAFPVSWEDRRLDQDSESDIGNNQHSVYLDSVYPGINKDSWIVMTSPSESKPPEIVEQVFEVKDSIETTRSDFAISAKVSRLRVESPAPPNTSLAHFRVRTTTVLGQSERLELAEVPIEDFVEGDDAITLDDVYFGLNVGQTVVLTGERSDLGSVIASEVRTIKEVIIEAGFTALTFEQSLTYSYVRSTVTINANIAAATHGETVKEVLGNGDASQPYQKFALRQPPLTYVSAANADGAESTLAVRVDDLLWHEVATLYGQGSKDHVYVSRHSNDNKTTIEFGDGFTGARLPSGQNNVSAVYRKGIGLDGLVKSGQLSMLLSRPLGVKGVTNPLQATGAEDPEQLSDARRNAPLKVLTLDRIVSARDYEDFAAAFAGIAKALATWTWDGHGPSVFVTVAGPNGARVKSDSATYDHLLKAMQNAGDPFVRLRIESYRPVSFRIAANVKIKPDFAAEKVLPTVEQALRARFAFAVRAFAQAVMLSEVIAVMQGVSGVMAVDVDKFYRSDAASATLEQRLLADLPVTVSDSQVAGAELLTLDPGPLDYLGVMQ